MKKILGVLCVSMILIATALSVAGATDDEELLISEITGGLFKVKVKLENNGTADMENVSVNIKLDGGFIFLGKETNDTVAKIEVGKNATIESKLIFGIGKTDINVTATYNETIVSAKASAFIFGPLVLGVGEIL